jgi:predicted RNA binding protein YcfA (HicA-like mRNA interferase family)
MTGLDMIRLLERRGCVRLRQTGSHARVDCEGCRTTVPVHRARDLPKGTLRGIERDLEPCLGVRWLRTAS